MKPHLHGGDGKKLRDKSAIWKRACFFNSDPDTLIGIGGPFVYKILHTGSSVNVSLMSACIQFLTLCDFFRFLSSCFIRKR